MPRVLTGAFAMSAGAQSAPMPHRDRHEVLRAWREAEARASRADATPAERAAVARLQLEYQELAAEDPAESVDLARSPSAPIGDHELDVKSRQLLAEVEDLRRLEREKRNAARSSPEFHALAEEIERRARRVFQITIEQRLAGAQDSPFVEEREERQHGDWTDGRPPRPGGGDDPLPGRG